MAHWWAGMRQERMRTALQVYQVALHTWEAEHGSRLRTAIRQLTPGVDLDVPAR
jgi:hypothetical protein